MARYIDAEKLEKNLELSIKSWGRDCNSNAPKMVAAYQEILYRVQSIPAADVAPRAEVAREIFEEIDAIIQRNTEHAIRNGFIRVSGYNCKQIVRLIYELKKKYTEEGK